MVTQERLKELLKYDSDTGIFTRKISRGPRYKKGSVAGSNNYYNHILIGIDGTNYRAHRLAWLYTYGEFPKKFLDHINGDPSDNRFCNLREASNQENQFNSAKRVDNTSGYKGVGWRKKSNKFIARISYGNKRINLGSFDSAIEAHEAYKKASLLHHKNFSRLD